VAQAAPVPAIYHNLGVEYAKTQNVKESRQAFELSKAKIAEVAAAAANNRPLSATALKPPTASLAWHPNRIERSSGDDDRRIKRTIRGAE
jgi:hypothetical protein